jgi:dTDP-4-dehydrorhamnose reductase
MRLLLTGKNGQLGFELQRALTGLGEVRAIDQQDCDLADPAAIRRLLAEYKPDIIINPAAYTAVDKAEGEPDLAFAINGVAPGVLGEAAVKLGALVVHYSTDYVFDGTKSGAYSEEDLPNPQSVYGKSKLAGEQALQASGARNLVLRTSWVVGAHGANFAKTILRLAAQRDSLAVVADQFGAPTSAALLADCTAALLRRYQQQGPAAFPCGLYHLVADGLTTWHAYAQWVVDAAEAAGWSLQLNSAAIKAISTAEYPLPAPRPANSHLATNKFRDTFALPLPNWQAALAPVLQQILATEQSHA